MSILILCERNSETCVYMSKKNVLRVYNTAIALSYCLDDVSKVRIKITDFFRNFFNTRFDWT